MTCDIQTTMERLKVCVIVPTYNNQNTLLEVVSRIRNFSRHILVINDGSTDDTQRLLEQCGYPELTVVGYAENRGKGHALRAGFRRAMEMGFDYAITIDSDGQHYPEDIPLFIQQLEKSIDAGDRNVLIVGNRKLVQKNMPGGNTFANYFSNFWFAVQTWQYLPDTQTGFRLYPLQGLRGLVWLTSRYEAELELLVFAAWHGVQLVSVPIRVYYPPKEERVSHFRPFWDFLRISILNTILCVLCFVYGYWLIAWHKMRRLLLVSAVLICCTHGIDAQRLTPYLAEGEAPTPAIIICPGGSYSWLDLKTEGEDVARWLQQQGITAFVLEYPVQGFHAFWSHYRYVVRGHQHPDALLSLQEAIKEIRQNAGELNVDPKRLGTMGFSAGGHLAVMSGEFFTSYDDRPDFIVSVYPVVTLRESPWTHKRSRRALLGEYRSHETLWQESLSLELHVRGDMPPVFLVNCKDDPVVHYHNSELLDSALYVMNIDHYYLQLEHGGHGFGIDTQKAGPEAIQWKDRFMDWFDFRFR